LGRHYDESAYVEAADGARVVPVRPEPRIVTVAPIAA
jgi:hypothetical protein